MATEMPKDNSCVEGIVSCCFSHGKHDTSESSSSRKRKATVSVQECIHNNDQVTFANQITTCSYNQRNHNPDSKEDYVTQNQSFEEPLYIRSNKDIPKFIYIPDVVDREIQMQHKRRLFAKHEQIYYEGQRRKYQQHWNAILRAQNGQCSNEDMIRMRKQRYELELQYKYFLSFQKLTKRILRSNETRTMIKRRRLTESLEMTFESSKTTFASFVPSPLGKTKDEAVPNITTMIDPNGVDFTRRAILQLIPKRIVV